MIKHEIELVKMRRAAEISELVLAEVITMISPSVTEVDIAAEITFQHRKLG